MRVLFVSTSRFPDAAANSVATYSMAAALAEAGCTVRLLGRVSDSETSLAAFYGVVSTAQLRAYPAVGRRRADRLLQLGSAAAQRVGWKPDLIYSRDPVSLLAIPRSRAAVVYEVHHPPPPQHQRLEDRLLRHRPPDVMVFISSALRDHYRDTGRLVAPHHLVCASGAHVHDLPLPLGERLQIGYIGHLYPGRAAMVPDLARAVPEHDFCLVGEVRTELRDPPPNMVVRGVVPPREVRGVLAGLDICLAPYSGGTRSAGGRSTARWFSPLKVPEAMGAGRVVIASDIPALRELVRADQDAVLCAAGSVEEWSRVIRELAEDHERCRQIGDAARERVANELTWKVRARRILEALRPASGAKLSGFF